MAGRGAGLCPWDLAPRPGTPELDRPTRTVVRRPGSLEMRQRVLRAVSRPQGEKTMDVVLERSAATHRDEPRIADLGEDHRVANLARACAKDRRIEVRRIRW
jgi:nucleoid-associated protein YgaU